MVNFAILCSVCLCGSILSPIWGPLYINYVLGSIANRFVMGESGSVYRLDNDGHRKYVKIETKFERIVSSSGSAPWALLVGGVIYTFEPFKATYYLPNHLLEKGFDRKD
jgi:hypothetical protein